MKCFTAFGIEPNSANQNLCRSKKIVTKLKSGHNIKVKRSSILLILISIQCWRTLHRRPTVLKKFWLYVCRKFGNLIWFVNWAFSFRTYNFLIALLHFRLMFMRKTSFDRASRFCRSQLSLFPRQADVNCCALCELTSKHLRMHHLNSDEWAMGNCRR